MTAEGNPRWPVNHHGNLRTHTHTVLEVSIQYIPILNADYIFQYMESTVPFPVFAVSDLCD